MAAQVHILNRFKAFVYRHIEPIQQEGEMIPASYLFKQVYHQHWEAPDAPVVTQHNQRFFDGLVSPLTAAITAMRTRRGKLHHHQGRHAYD